MNNKFVWTKRGTLIYKGDVPETKKDALDVSISKWEHIIKRFHDMGSFLDEGAMSTCGLCMLYIDDNCKDCPVAKKSMAQFCENSPYIDWCESHSLIDAEAELEFLLELKKELGYE